jgi:prepilin-type N-terminal cleavage/methylation domain-containing protein
MVKRTRPLSSAGFTIIELLISLTVLSLILVMATVIIIQIGNFYFKGVNTANLQNSSRNISADLTSALQFGGQQPWPCDSATDQLTCFAIPDTGPIGGMQVYAFCIGTTRYSYVLNRELGTDSSTNVTTNHVLWRDIMNNNSACPKLDLTAPKPSDANSQLGSGYEMMPPNMRLTRFRVVENPANSGIYNVDVWMAYGDDDLVNSDATGRSTCNGGYGTQFCAISHLSTSVIRRLEN